MSIIILILNALCLIVIAKIASAIYHYFALRRALRDIPCLPGSYPFIGESLLCMKMTDYERGLWYLQLADTFTDGLFVLWFGTKPIIHIYKPEYLEAILPSTTHIGKELPYDLLEPWLGKGLLTSSGPQWFHDRRMIGPTFHFAILEQFAVIFSEKAELLTKCLEEAVEKNPREPIDIFPFALHVAVDIICETAMGVNVNDQNSGIDYTAMVRRISTLTMDRMYQPWYWINWLYYLMPVGREYKKILNVLHGFTKEESRNLVHVLTANEKDFAAQRFYKEICGDSHETYNVISKKKAARKLENGRAEGGSEEEQSDVIGEKKKKVFLDLLLDQNEKDDAPLSDDELRAQVDTFMFEGHDTTAVAITWALFCLGNNLEHQEKVHQELEEVFGDSQEPANLKELSQLKYLDRVIKEVLRIFPSVPAITRKLEESVKIDKHTIPRNSVISLLIVSTHRKPSDWPDPMKFDPDRFLPENTKSRNPYAYIPFSAGPRNCVGQRFAQLEEKIVLTAILRKWRVQSKKPIEEVVCGATLTLRPLEEVLIHFTKK